MAAKLADLISEWIWFHPKLKDHFKVVTFENTPNPTHWPFTHDAYVGMTCDMKGATRFQGDDAVALIAIDFVIISPDMIIAADPNFFKILEEWLVAYHNGCYHQI